MMKNFARHPCRCSPPRRQSGLSLVELMISLTIGLVLLAGITTLIVQQSGARREMEQSSRQIENGRYAMEILRGDIEHAGFYGEYAVPASATYNIPGPCNTGAGVGNHGWDPTTTPVTLPVPIHGTPGISATPAGCTVSAADRKAGTAMLTVRRTDTATIDSAAAAAGVTYFQVSRCNSDTQSFIVTTPGDLVFRQKDCAAIANVRRYLVRTYYINSDNILKMLEFADGSLNTISLVDGIENMQFEYGIDTTGDGVPDSYNAAPTTTAEWSNVMAVRVYLLARNNESTPGYTDNKTYYLSASAPAVAPGGAFKRHAYSQLVRAVNPSGRRE